VYDSCHLRRGSDRICKTSLDEFKKLVGKCMEIHKAEGGNPQPIISPLGITANRCLHALIHPSTVLEQLVNTAGVFARNQYPRRKFHLHDGSNMLGSPTTHSELALAVWNSAGDRYGQPKPSPTARLFLSPMHGDAIEIDTFMRYSQTCSLKPLPHLFGCVPRAKLRMVPVIIDRDVFVI